MNAGNTNSTSISSLKADTISGIVLVILAVPILIFSRSTTWQDIGSGLGFALISLGLPLISWRLIVRSISPNMINIIQLMRKEKLLEIMRDQEKGKLLITKCFLEWARSQGDSVIKIKGVTLNLAFANRGILRGLIGSSQLINPDKKRIQALLLNPYSMNAITRSIQEGRPFGTPAGVDPVREICEHTLDRHKSNVLYRDFDRTVHNIKDLISNSSTHKVEIECRIYSALSPSFLLISDQRAIMENLILSPKRDPGQQKLYGALPHLVYGNGGIKDSLESHFDYMWDYDSVPLEDFHEEVEEKYFEINRLFLLYRLQPEIWERQWRLKGRSFASGYDELYQVYMAEPRLQIDSRRRILILDVGCGDGGGGSLGILKDHPNAKTDFVDLSPTAIKYLQDNISILERSEGLSYQYSLHAGDMLTFLNNCQSCQYSLVYANFSIIYMTKIKAIEVYRRIFSALQNGGVFMLSLWTSEYFNMPIGRHGEEGVRPPHEFVRIPMTEDLRVLIGGSERRVGEIRRFYRDREELLEEFKIADEDHVMDLDSIECRYYENGAILRVWLRKR